MAPNPSPASIFRYRSLEGCRAPKPNCKIFTLRLLKLQPGAKRQPADQLPPTRLERGEKKQHEGAPTKSHVILLELCHLGKPQTQDGVKRFVGPMPTLLPPPPPSASLHRFPPSARRGILEPYFKGRSGTSGKWFVSLLITHIGDL